MRLEDYVASGYLVSQWAGDLIARMTCPPPPNSSAFVAIKAQPASRQAAGGAGSCFASSASLRTASMSR